MKSSLIRTGNKTLHFQSLFRTLIFLKNSVAYFIVWSKRASCVPFYQHLQSTSTTVIIIIIIINLIITHIHALTLTLSPSLTHFLTYLPHSSTILYISNFHFHSSSYYTLPIGGAFCRVFINDINTVLRTVSLPLSLLSL